VGAVHSGKIAIFGAGGPVAASAAQALKDHYTLRLTDVRPLPEIAAGPPQSEVAPLPEVLPAPHEWSVVDVSSYEQVLEAARGMDALINCTVLRPHPVLAFHVNLLGAYNVAKAAVELGIKRIIHTGPYHVYLNHNADYWWDFDVPEDAPLRPGGDLYAHTKFLGGEVTRVFAERHGLEVVTFLYCNFTRADAGKQPDGSGVFPFQTSWEDTGEAFVYGLRAESLPRPYEPFFIGANLPNGKWPPRKAQRLLRFTPQHNFDRLWKRSSSNS
jgi:nucleoside-diphosphate-sugar epimerase